MSKFAVSSGHKMTTSAAADVLRNGGSAVDAAIAAAFMACIAEPVLASPLAGGFLTIAPASDTPKCLDFFVQTPKIKGAIADLDLREIEVDFGPTKQTFHCGAGTIATPGLIPGLFEAHQKYGTMPMPELAAAAVAAARAGVEVTPFQAEVFGYVKAIFQDSEGARNLYAPEGNLLTSGDILRNPRMADTLEVMAIEGPRFFQEGEVAQALLSLGGGQLTSADLSSYRPIWRNPLKVSRSTSSVFLNPSPSLGGAQIALCLNALPPNPDDVTLVRCFDLVANIRAEYDIDHHPEDGQNILLDPALIKDLKSTLQQHQTATRGTTHISIIDKQGMGASLTLSNGEGCGLIVPETGIMANNMLGEDDLVPDGPNSWGEDCRLASMMCPMAIRSEAKLMMMGSGGSNRIRSALTKVAIEVIDKDADLEEAIVAPRMHVEPTTTHVLDFENQGSEKRREELLRLYPHANVWDKMSMFFGGVHATSRDHKGNFTAVGDKRRDGYSLTD